MSNGFGSWEVGTGANPGGLPILKGGSWAGNNWRLNTNVVVFQQFTYTGTEASTFSLVGNLDFLTSGNDGLEDTGLVGGGGILAEQAGEGGIYAKMMLMNVNAFDGITTAQDVMNLLGGDCSMPGVASMVDFSGAGLSSGPHTAQLKLDKLCEGGAPIVVTPGATGVVAMILQTPSNRGGYTDAMHTFVSAFDPELPAADLARLQENFVPLSPKDLPEPSALALFAVAALGAIRMRRR